MQNRLPQRRLMFNLPMTSVLLCVNSSKSSVTPSQRPAFRTVLLRGMEGPAELLLAEGVGDAGEFTLVYLTRECSRKGGKLKCVVYQTADTFKDETLLSSKRKVLFSD